jgi:hypothetical protein
MKRTIIVAALAASGCASQQPARSIDVPQTLKPGATEELAMIVPAKGVQIYECRDAKWAFIAPEAELYDANGKRIGRHYAGPSWEAADGSRIVGAVKSRADAPGAGNIPWLLLSAKSVGAEGTFSRMTSVQRVSTSGGVAPAGACAASGEKARVGYTADYYLFAPKAAERY